MKPKYGEEPKLSYMDTGLEPIKKHWNKIGKTKVIGLMKDELGGKIMTEFAALRPKTYSYITDNNDENKKAKEQKVCCKSKNYFWML